MRVFPGGIGRRIDRLTRDVLPSPSAWRARLARMRDDELDHYLLKMYEKAAGPLADYLTAEELVSVLCRAPGFDSSPTLLDHAKRLWHRQHWFRLHAAHGAPQLVRVEPDSWRAGRPFGLGMVFECPCARNDPGNQGRGLFATYEYLVPEQYRNLIPREEQRAGIWVQ